MHLGGLTFADRDHTLAGVSCQVVGQAPKHHVGRQCWHRLFQVLFVVAQFVVVLEHLGPLGDRGGHLRLLALHVLPHHVANLGQLGADVAASHRRAMVGRGASQAELAFDCVEPTHGRLLRMLVIQFAGRGEIACVAGAVSVATQQVVVKRGDDFRLGQLVVRSHRCAKGLLAASAAIRVRQRAILVQLHLRQRLG